MHNVNALAVTLIAIATYRTTRLLAQDQITQPVRDRLDRWITEGHHDQDRHRTPSRKATTGAWLKELYECPWCLSVHVGFWMAVAWWAAVGVANPVLWVPIVALVASAATGIISQTVVLLERLADDQ